MYEASSEARKATALATIGSSDGVYGLTESNNLGFGNPQIFVSLFVGTFAVAVLIFVERRKEDPM